LLCKELRRSPCDLNKGRLRFSRQKLFFYSGFAKKTCSPLQVWQSAGIAKASKAACFWWKSSAIINDENGLTINLEKNMINAVDRSLNFSL
jgi:hypothetical protein